MQAFNFSKMNFSAPPKAALSGNSNNGTIATPPVATSPVVYRPVIERYKGSRNLLSSPKWNARQATPAVPNNLQKKLLSVARSGPRYTAKNRKLFAKWNRNIEEMENPRPSFFNRVATTLKSAMEPKKRKYRPLRRVTRKRR